MIKKAALVSLGLCLCLSLVAFIFVPPVQAVTCSSGAAAQNGVTVVPSHGSVFYIDTGVSPVLDAGYIGYRVTNSTGSSQTNLWTEVSSFSGGKVALANAADSMMQLPTLSNGSTGTSYFLLKGTGATTTAQSHTVKVYNGRPDLSGSSLLYQCSFSFAKVQETIKAASNKVVEVDGTGSAIEVSDTTPELGQLITVAVEGQTGNIGAGSAPDNDIIWLAPAAVSSWPTRALRLENVSITFDGNGNWAGTGDQVTYTNQLLITSANGLTNVDGSEYRATYSFRVTGQPSGSVSVVPVAQISSGTQVKHSDTSAAGATATISFSALAINAALSKSVTSTTGLATVDCSSSCAVPGGAGLGTYVEVPYRLTASTSTATSQVVDEFVDQPPSGLIFKPGSATVTDIGRTGVTLSDPVTISTDATPKPLHFVGPFTLNSGTTASVSYKMYVPVGSYANTAYAKLGDTLIGATSSAMSRITVTSTGTSSVGVVSDTVGFSVSAITDPASSIDTTSATLNGTVDPNGTSVLTGQFEYGTSPTLVGATTVTATTPVNGALGGLSVPTAVSYNVTGLSTGTTYYYRVVAGAAQGSILSFTTLAVQATPTVTTTAATSVTGTTAALNGTINPNLTAITGIQFIYGTSATLASGNTTTTVDDGSGTAALTASGSTAQAFSKGVTGLSNGTTYYFKIRACTSALTGSYPSVSCSSFVDGSILSFVPGLLSRTLTINSESYTTSYTLAEAAPTITSTASAGAGTKTYTSETASVCTVNSSSGAVTFVAVGTCTIGASIASDGTYNGATAESVSFSLSLAARSLVIDSSSYVSSYTMVALPPTITSTASAGSGTKTYSSSTTGVCTVNSSSGAVTFVAVGTCTIDATIASDGTYAAATASSVSFTVTLAPRTISINGGSYSALYLLADTPPTVTSTASAGSGTKTYSSSTTGVCTVNSSSGLVAFVDVGTCSLAVSIAADGTYASASSLPVSFDVSAVPLTSRTLTILEGSFTSSYSIISQPPTIAASPSGGAGTKTFSSGTTGVCTVNTSTGVVTFVSTGTCTIGATIASDGTYATATATAVSFSVTLASRTLSIDEDSFDGTYTVLATAPTLTSTATAGTGTKSYTSSTTDVCTVNSSSGTVTFIATGLCSISASIASDGTYVSANADAVAFDVTLAPRTLEIDQELLEDSYAVTGAPPTVSSTASAGGGTKTYTSSTTGVCTVDEASGAVTFVSAGTCTIAASISAQGGYASANAAGVSFTVSTTSRGNAISSNAYPPSNAFLSINGGASCTGSRTVVLSYSATLATEVMLANTVAESGTWIPFGGFGTTEWELPAADGSYTVYVNFRNATGSAAVNASIVLDRATACTGVTPPVPTSSPAPEPTSTPISVTAPTPASPSAPQTPTASAPASGSSGACVACARLAYDVYIVNPDRSERHTGTPYVLTAVPAPGVTRYFFEDATDDPRHPNYDHNDVIVDTNVEDPANVSVLIRSSSAAWKHQVRLRVLLDGKTVRDVLIAKDDDRQVGSATVLNVATSVGLDGGVYERGCRPASPFTKRLSVGMSGEDIRSLQVVLQCLGFFPSDTVPNGRFGDITYQAVIAYQKASGLPLRGYVGPLTRASLNR